MELKYSFLQLVPFMETRLDVLHDDFVSVVHNAERSMEDYSDKQIHESFKEKFDAVDAQMLNDLPCCLEDIARLLLREWACTAGTDGDIVCPSNSALSVISSESAKEYGEIGLGLRRWMDDKVFPLLSKKLEDVAVAENITVFIETEEERGGELLFRLESPRCSRSPTDCCRTIFHSFLFSFIRF
ncbi:hypothetical protein OWV82_020254 [Melia azedarach]|uniref:Uncharacterized protein n=1 Tax=Melia azedarach TaxID=155640 RepID=A0ACC1X7E9_MELAZ|nr:hypothetical protein OWV82_020254 [Melia azedarach]